MSIKASNSRTESNAPKRVSTREEDKMLSNFYSGIAKNIISCIIIIFFYIGVFSLISNFGKQAYNFTYPIFGDTAVDVAPGRSVEIVISKKDDLRDIAMDLQEKGVIKNEESFYIRGKLSINKNRMIEPGTYILNTSENNGEILNILTNAEEVED